MTTFLNGQFEQNGQDLNLWSTAIRDSQVLSSKTSSVDRESLACTDKNLNKAETILKEGQG